MKKLNYFLMAVTVITASIFSSCSKDDEGNGPDKVEISNPDAITESLKIANAIVKDGTPPAPSSDAEAPEIESYNDTQIGISGNNLALYYDLNNGDVAGAYLQVEGSNKYYDINLSNNAGRIGKKETHNKMFARVAEDNPPLVIELPEGLEPGEFCVLYCVYDAQNRVSNIVEVCIEVKSFGGENSSFLTANEWSAVYYEDTYVEDGVEYTEKEFYGESYDSSWDYYCDETEEYVTIEESYIEEYLNIKFSSNGAFAYENKWSTTELDYATSDPCNGVFNYDEETYTDSAIGGWSYDDDNKTLSIVMEYEYEEDGEVYTEYEAVLFDAELVNGNLELSETYTDGDYSETYKIVFAKK